MIQIVIKKDQIWRKLQVEGLLWKLGRVKVKIVGERKEKEKK